MATTAQIVYDPCKGVRLIATITVQASYPDAVDQARLECIKLFHDAVAEARPDWTAEVADGEASAPDA